MTPDDDLTPRLGRIRDIGGSGGKRFARQIKRAAKQLSPPRSSSRFTGRQSGRGSAKARQFAFQSQRLAASRMRRVMVKVHIARGGRGGGIGAFRAHVSYIQRDGVDRNGIGGELYTREAGVAEAGSFLERSGEDRHQFRLIVSPEDGVNLNDLKPFTRDFMRQVERDLGTRLDWVAVDHHNTGHPHTHIVIRGQDERGKDLVFAPDYIKSGLRHRARELATEILGPRRDIEIAKAKHSEISKDRFTGIDRKISADLKGQDLRLRSGLTTSADRHERSLRLQRLRHLQALGLAREMSKDVWRFSDDWESTLRDLGRRGDIIRNLAAKHGPQDGHERLQSFKPGEGARQTLLGEVVSSLPNDELKGTRTLIIKDFSNDRWIVGIGRSEPGALPPDNAVVEISSKTSRPGAADQTIAHIADKSGGLFSEDLHKGFDPAASSDYRKAHVRRLEALRGAGIVERSQDGVWQVPPDYLERAAAYERRKDVSVKVDTRSWLSIERQVNYRGLTWLDGAGAGLESGRVQNAVRARRNWLRANGWLEQGQERLSSEMAEKLAAADLDAAAARLANHSGRNVKWLGIGEEMNGTYEGAVNLGNKRLAIIANSKEFALVPWRREIERYRGRDMIARRTRGGTSWTLGRTKDRGISR
jgi:type IV secretory pathway VirD2 relaxase